MPFAYKQVKSKKALLFTIYYLLLIIGDGIEDCRPFDFAQAGSGLWPARNDRHFS